MSSRPLDLRPYQASAIQALREAMREHRRVILASPTGSGKTEMGMEIIRGAIAKGKRVAFLANRVHLVGQTSARFLRAGIDHGIIQAENTYNPWSPVLVCSIQTVARRGLPEVDLVVIDEAHTAAGTKAYREIMKGLPVIGLSATPFSKGLGKHYEDLGGPLFETVVEAAKIRDLIRDGYLVDAVVYAPSEPDLENVSIKAGDYDEKELGEAVDKPALIGDIVEHWLRLADGSSTVCFATNIAHSKHIVDQFEKAGVTAEHLDCYTSDYERKAILARVQSGETKVVSNVGILCEGWDFPACKTLILARPTRSLIRYLQMAGRVLRPHEHKPHALILDHSGVVARLGFPWDDQDMRLDKGTPAESKAKERCREPRMPSPCPKCFFMREVGVRKCPKCGHESLPPVDIVSTTDQLVPVTEKRKKVQQLAELSKQDVYSQLRYIAVTKGYSDGWVSHKYRTIFDVWPRGLSKEPKEPSGVLLAWIRSEQIRWAKSRLNHG